MRVGFIGSGNMARAIAVGLGVPASFSDSGSGRAQAVADAVAGSTGSNVEVAERSDLLFLAHKPAQLSDVAAQLGGYSGTIVSILAATPLSALKAAYPSATVLRSMPNIPVENGNGVFAIASESDQSPEAIELLEKLGAVVDVPEAEFEIATAIGGCAPAFLALFAEHLVESAVKRGMDADLAKTIVGQTFVGTGQTLSDNGMDTSGLQKAVASPGGLTERALSSFSESQLQDAVDRAVATVLGETG